MSSSIGIAITKHAYRAARAARSGGSWKILSSAAAEDLTGATKPIAALLTSLKKKPKGTKVVCSLPAESLYAALVTLRASRGSDVSRQIEVALESAFPESVEISDVTYTRLLQKEGLTRFAVQAFSPEAIRAIEDEAKELRLSLRGYTTLPLSLVASERVLQKGNCILVAATLNEVTVSLFSKGVLIDESVLQSDITPDRALAEVNQLREEYEGILGPCTLYTFGSLVLEGATAVLTSLQTLDPLYLEAALASTVRPAAKRNTSHGKRWIIAFLFFLLLAGGAFAYSRLRELMPASPVVTEPVVTAFEDVFAGDKNFDATQWAASKKILVEEGATVFAPELPVSRAEFLRAVVTLAAREDVTTITEPSGFTDTVDHPELNFVLRYAKREGIISGTEFRPDDSITVASALKIAYTGLGIVPDSSATEPWFAPYQEDALQRGILLDDAMQMEGELTREQAAWMLWKLTVE